MIFHTERLVIRQIAEDDLAHLLEMNNNPNVMKFISTSGFNPSSASEELKSIKKQQLYYKKHQNYGLWMIDAPYDTVGWISLKYNGDLNGFELGYRLKEKAWGKGYATEACLGLIKYAAFFGVKTIYAVAVKENTASIHVMKKIGMTFKRTDYCYDEIVEVYGYDYE